MLVNGPTQVWVDRGRGLEPADVRFADDGEVRRLAQRLAAATGRRLDDSSPFVDTRLPDGTRVHAVLGHPGRCRAPACRSGCRRGGRSRWRTASPPERSARAWRRVLTRLVESRAAFLVSGGTGSGKTTLLAALLALVPPGERLVVVEDSRELRPDHPHVVSLEGRPANAEGRGRDRPDRPGPPVAADAARPAGGR